MKALRKYLLALAVFLMSGYGLLHAHFAQDFRRLIPAQMLGKWGHAVNRASRRHSVGRASYDNNERVLDKAYSEENNREGNDMPSPRKAVAASGYPAPFYTHHYERFFCYLQKCQAVDLHFLCRSVSRYLLLRVIRI